MVVPLALPSAPVPPAPSESRDLSFTDGRARRYLRPPAPLFFPVEEEMPETRRHLFLRTLLLHVVLRHFGKRATAGSGQFVFWDPTDPNQRCAPDLFVQVGPRDAHFDSWKTWERGAPHLVVEITSASDAPEAPWQEKLARFRRIGVREVVRFNPDSAETPLQIWDAIDGDLIERDPTDPTFRACVTLGAHWVVVPYARKGPALRLSKDAEGRELYATGGEVRRAEAKARRAEIKARKAEAKARRAEAKAREAAEARVRELEAELAKRK